VSMDASALFRETRIVPVVVINRADQASELARTLLRAGLNRIEVTLRTDEALGAIERIAAEVPEMVVGAGSVRKPEQFDHIARAGARFAVSPGSSERLLEKAADTGMPLVPGAATASEVLVLLERGYRLQKFFPAEQAGGVAALKSLGAPLPEAMFFPTGGITPANAREYLSLPNVACIGGSWIAPVALLEQGQFTRIAGIAEDAVALAL